MLHQLAVVEEEDFGQTPRTIAWECIPFWRFESARVKPN